MEEKKWKRVPIRMRSRVSFGSTSIPGGERMCECICVRVCVFVCVSERVGVHACVYERAAMHLLLGNTSAAVKQQEEKSKRRRRDSRMRSSHIGRNNVQVFESSLSQCWGILP